MAIVGTLATGLLGGATNALGNTLGMSLFGKDKAQESYEKSLQGSADYLGKFAKASELAQNQAGALGLSAQRQAEIALSNASQAGADAIFGRAEQRGLANQMLNTARAQAASSQQLAERNLGGMSQQMLDTARVAGNSPAAMMSIARQMGEQAGQTMLASQAQGGQIMGNAATQSAGTLANANQQYDQSVNTRYQREVVPRLVNWKDKSNLVALGAQEARAAQESGDRFGLINNPLATLGKSLNAMSAFDLNKFLTSGSETAPTAEVPPETPPAPPIVGNTTLYPTIEGQTETGETRSIMSVPQVAANVLPNSPQAKVLSSNQVQGMPLEQQAALSQILNSLNPQNMNTGYGAAFGVPLQIDPNARVGSVFNGMGFNGYPSNKNANGWSQQLTNAFNASNQSGLNQGAGFNNQNPAIPMQTGVPPTAANYYDMFNGLFPTALNAGYGRPLVPGLFRP